MKPQVTIQNVVASARFKHGFDLIAILRAFPTAEYRPQTFPGLIFRLEKPKASTLIFSSGKMVCTGTKGENEAKRAVNKVAGELRKAGLVIHGKPETNIVNIVASVDLGDVTIDIEESIYVAQRLGVNIIYEPDQFPGAIYRMEDPKTVFLIFSSGKLVCTGATREIDVHRAVEKLVVILEENGLVFRR